MTWTSAALAAGLSLLAGTAAAQPLRMEFLGVVNGQPAMTEIDATPPAIGALVQESPFSPAVFGPNAPDVPILLAGGRYIAWINWGRGGADVRTFSLFDRRTRTAYGPLGATAATFMVADPIRPRLFVNGLIHPSLPAGPITMFDASDGSVRSVFPSSPPQGDTVAGFAYAGAADELIVPMQQGLTIATARIVRVATGAVVRQIPWPAEATSWDALEVSADARRVYVKLPARYDCTSGTCVPVPAPVLALDGQTGAELARSTPFDVPGGRLVAGSGRAMVVDETAGRLLVYTNTGRLVVLDAMTLAIVADVAVTTPGSLFWVFAGLGPVAAITVGSASDGSCQLDAWDATYLARVPPAGPCPSGIPVLARVPLSPGDVVAQVTGARVDLSWTTPGDTAGFEVVVGFAPGAPLVTIPAGTGAAATFRDVPAGVYYVSVRGLNENGPGFTSAEVRVEVR